MGRYSDFRRNHLGSIAWSPDGTKVAFGKTRIAGVVKALMLVRADDAQPREVGQWNCGCCYPERSIYVIDPDGTDQRWLANGDDPRSSP